MKCLISRTEILYHKEEKRSGDSVYGAEQAVTC